MYFAYVLQSEKTFTFYYGSTQDLISRLETHNAGLVKYSSKFRPWKIVYFEEFPTRSDALRREKFFKTGAGRDFIKRKLAIKEM